MIIERDVDREEKKKKNTLSEIAPGTGVRLAVYGRHNTCAYFDSRVLEISEVDRPYLSSKNFSNILILKLFREGSDEERVVNFESEDIVCELMIKETKEVYKDIFVRRIDLPIAGDVHAVITHEKVDFVNRRRAYRIFIGLNGAVNTEDHLSANVIVRDISAIGAAFICSPKFDVYPGDKVTLSFVDQVDDRQFFIIMPCTVVRVAPARGGNRIVGCSCIQEVPMVGKYMVLKQQERQRLFRRPLRVM
nr:PilZ domain-containing protein [Lachnospiraceae bacterium]